MALSINHSQVLSLDVVVVVIIVSPHQITSQPFPEGQKSPLPESSAAEAPKSLGHRSVVTLPSSSNRERAGPILSIGHCLNFKNLRGVSGPHSPREGLAVLSTPKKPFEAPFLSLEMVCLLYVYCLAHCET